MRGILRCWLCWTGTLARPTERLKWLALGCAVLVVVARVQADGNTSAEQAVLYLQNGDYVTGTFTNSDGEDHIRWKSSLFRDSLSFRLAGIERIVFGQQPPIPKPTPQHTARKAREFQLQDKPRLQFRRPGMRINVRPSEAISNPKPKKTLAQPALNPLAGEGSRIVTAGQNILYGDVVSVSDGWLTANTGRHGQVRFRLDSVHGVQGFSRESSYLFSPGGNLRAWRSIGKNRSTSQWKQTGTHLTTHTKGANLFFQIEDKGPYVAELTLSSAQPLEFQFVMGCSKHAHKLKNGFSLEMWDDRLMVCRQPGNELKFSEFEKPTEGFLNELSLQMFFNPREGEVVVLSGGVLLGRFQDRQALESVGTGFLVRNRGASLSVADFRLRQWNGKIRPFFDQQAHEYIELTDGRLIPGRLVNFDAATGKATVRTQLQTLQFDKSEVDEIAYSPLGGESIPKPNIRIEYLDGGALVGQLLGVVEDGVLVAIPGSPESVLAGWSRMSQIGSLAKEDETRNDQLRKNGLVQRQGCRLHGCVVSADLAGTINWEPAYSHETAAFDLAQSARVSFEPRDASDVLGTVTDEVFLTNGDKVPCSLQAIDGQYLVIRSLDGTTSEIPRSAFKAVRRLPDTARIYSGFKPGDKWMASGGQTDSCELIDGALRFSGTACIAREFDLSLQVSLSFDVHWHRDASLTVGIGGDTVENAVHRTQNRAFTKEMMEQAVKHKPDYALEVSLNCKGRTLTVHGLSRSLGVFGSFRRQLHGRNRTKRTNPIPLGENASAHIEVLVDRSCREYVVRANGQQVCSWKDSSRLEGDFVHLATQPVVTKSKNDASLSAASGALLSVYNFRISRWSGFLSEEDRERVLTRRLGARPHAVSHIVRAVNGDTLRGRLVSMQGDTVLFKSRLDTLVIPLHRLTEIIALQEVEATEAESAFKVQLHGGGCVTLKPKQITDSIVRGLSPLVGELSIPWKLVSAIELGKPEPSNNPFGNWTLHEPKTLPDVPLPQTRTSNLVDKPAPDFELDTLDGQRVALADFKGKVVILDFWASWCGPCVAAMPSLIELSEQFGDGVILLGANQQEDADEIQTFLATQSWELNIGLDTSATVAGQFGVTAIPFTVIIDKLGIVRHVHQGAGPGLKEHLERELDELINVPPGT